MKYSMHKKAVRKGLIFSVVVITLAFFIFIMKSGGLLKQSFNDHDDVKQYVADLDEAIGREQWGKSAILYTQLEDAWRTVSRRVQFSVERDDLEGFNQSLASLKGSIRARSVENAIIHLEEVKSFWKHLEG